MGRQCSLRPGDEAVHEAEVIGQQEWDTLPQACPVGIVFEGPGVVSPINRMILVDAEWVAVDAVTRAEVAAVGIARMIAKRRHVGTVRV